MGTENSKWYHQNSDIYDSFRKKIELLTKEIINESKIPYHSISSRLKTKDSFLKKCENKNYDDPDSQVMDMAGIRIIAYTKSDVDKIADLIKNEFQIDQDNSENKTEQMAIDQIGYLSVHSIASISDGRKSLIEYSRYEGLKCEIQIRTLLQHAWAEIEHDRSYKFGGVLPDHLKRRFYLVAGALEIIDNEFQNLSDEIDKYKDKISDRTLKGDFDSPINSITLLKYLCKKYNDLPITYSFVFSDDKIIQELFDFDVKTIKDLDSMITDDVFKKSIDLIKLTNEDRGAMNFIGVLRNVMLLVDHKKYFQKSWKRNWTFMLRTDFLYFRENGIYINDEELGIGLATEVDFG